MRRLELAAIVSATALGMSAAGCGNSSPARTSACPAVFDAHAWRSAPEVSAERRALAKQLVRCRFLEHSTKRSVRRMLGQPERLDTQSRGEYARRWTYYLGDTPDTGYGPGDAINLEVVFDRDARVRQVGLSPGA